MVNKQCIVAALATALQLVISEWGIGGGTQDGNGVAPDVTFAAGHPFFGLWYPYSDGKNPWKQSSFADYRSGPSCLQARGSSQRAWAHPLCPAFQPIGDTVCTWATHSALVCCAVLCC